MAITIAQLRKVLNMPAVVFESDGCCLTDRAKVVPPPSGENAPVVLYLPKILRGLDEFRYIRPNLRESSLHVDSGVASVHLSRQYRRGKYDKPVDEETASYLRRS